jgi:glutathione synthase/RimK-type ligase-like ATP-grasp enzyme
VAVDGDVVDQLRARTFHAGLMEWADVTGALVINRPTAMESNSSKPFQAQLIARAGFAVPETLVTSEPELAAEFAGSTAG